MKPTSYEDTFLYNDFVMYKVLFMNKTSMSASPPTFEY